MYAEYDGRLAAGSLVDRAVGRRTCRVVPALMCAQLVSPGYACLGSGGVVIFFVQALSKDRSTSSNQVVIRAKDDALNVLFASALYAESGYVLVTSMISLDRGLAAGKRPHPPCCR